jgi:putative copper resistance protein D
VPPEFTSIAIRFALYANLMALFGLPMFALYTPAHGSPVLAISKRLFGMLAISAALLSIASIVVMSAAMSGVAVTEVERASIAAMVFETPMGTAWLARIGVLVAALVLIMSKAERGSALNFSIVILSGIALSSLAWTGHGAAGEGTAGSVQLVADIVHLLAAGAWFGALLALGASIAHIMARDTLADVDIAHRALATFASAGSIIVALLIITGLVSAWSLIGPLHVLDLTEGAYGRLFLCKLAMFAAMLLLAAKNRFRLVPELAHASNAGIAPRVAIRKLRLSIALETVFAVVILATVAWLGTLAPPMAG